MDEERWDVILNSIASGIEMRLQLHMGLADIATEETRNIARKLDIPEEEIQLWAAYRKNQAGNIRANLESLLAMLKSNAMAQDIFSNFVPYQKPEQGQDKLN